jgi:dCTP deaminase
MILADSAILNEIDKGNILITPFNPKSLGSNSYDVCLSDKLAVYRTVCAVSNGDNVHLWKDVNNYKHRQDDYLDAKAENEIIDLILPEEGLVLKPGILYLGTTLEYTKTRNLVPYLEGKSSMGRLGIKVHVTAGKGDIGFEGHWTLEIEVTHPVKVYPGMKVAQLSYFRPEGFCINPYNKKKDAKYNNDNDIPVPSRNNLNFKGGDSNSYFHQRFKDSGIAGLPNDEDE